MSEEQLKEEWCEEHGCPFEYFDDKPDIYPYGYYDCPICKEEDSEALYGDVYK